MFRTSDSGCNHCDWRSNEDDHLAQNSHHNCSQGKHLAKCSVFCPLRRLAISQSLIPCLVFDSRLHLIAFDMHTVWLQVRKCKLTLQLPPVTDEFFDKLKISRVISFQCLYFVDKMGCFCFRPECCNHAFFFFLCVCVCACHNFNRFVPLPCTVVIFPPPHRILCGVNGAETKDTTTNTFIVFKS